MSHYLMIPINENGIIFDVDMNSVVTEAMAVSPFNFRDIYLYSHGWSNDAARAMDEYNRFSVDFSKYVTLLDELTPPLFVDGPNDSLGVGIHWPSEITEDPDSDLNKLQLLTFYTMEHRADSVGSNAVYTMLRLMLKERQGRGVPPRFHLLGHSFGCKVMLSALQDLQTDIANNTIAVPPGTTFNLVLLEPATDADNLEDGDIYGNVSKIEGLRVLITSSQCDAALVKWFHLAGALANVVHKPLAVPGELLDPSGPPQALGAVGPTDATITAFGGPMQVARFSLTPGFLATKMLGANQRLIVADLTPLHLYRVQQQLYNGGFAGSHSDINLIEIYHLVAGFLFGVGNATPIPPNCAPGQLVVAPTTPGASG
jgi:hypothetical protein